MEQKELLKKALVVAKKSMPDYDMIKCYDYGNMYYFSCKRKGTNELSNAPFICKNTLKQLSIPSYEAMMLGDYLNVFDIEQDL